MRWWVLLGFALLLPACNRSRDRQRAKAGVEATANVCFAYRRSSSFDEAAADVLVAMLPSERGVLDYKTALDAGDGARIGELEQRAAKLRPGTKLRKLWRGAGWVKVLVVGSPDGNVAGYLLDHECNPLPPKGVLPK